MIAPPWQTGVWRRELAEAFRQPEELLRALGLSPEAGGGAPVDIAVERDFPLRVPRSFVARMRPGDRDDPLLRQVLPLAQESLEAPGFSRDPLLERSDPAAARLPQGVLHKYQGRVLLLVVGACAIHCRYCFRRHFPYEAHRLNGDLDAALAYLAGDPSVVEVILSGGDPWSAPDEVLAPLIERLDAIGHLRRLRIHTRMPVVLPERVDAELLAWLERSRLHKVVVLHANHAQEIDRRVRTALELLRERGVVLLHQAVLLRGVNDSVEALAELCESLFAAGVLPYYLHLLDRVQGAAHFEVEEERAVELLAGLMARLPGYLVPRLVREVPGALAKVPVVVPSSRLFSGA